MFERIHWYESGKFHVGLIIAGFTVFLVFLLVSLGSSLIKLWQRKKQSAQQYSKTSKVAWALALLTSILVLLSPVTGIVMALLTKEHQLYNIPPILYVMLSFLLAASVIGLTLPVFAVFAWRNRFWSLPSRLLFSLVSLTCLFLMPFMNYWNVFGFRF
jgi:uncharacterized membrane protein